MIKFKRWPWMNMEAHWSHFDIQRKKYGWGRVPGMARFGGGWDWKLGISIGQKCIIINLLFGLIIITW